MSDQSIMVIKAFKLLQSFSVESRALTFGELVAATGFSKTTTHRLVKTLVALGCLTQEPPAGRYHPGPKLLELADVFLAQLDVRTAANGYLIDLAEETSETAFLVVPDDDDALCIGRVEGNHEVRVLSLRLGARLPLHCGAGPLALLAGMPDDKITSVLLSKGLKRRTDYSIGDTDELFREITLTRERGYTVRRNDVTEGVGSIGAPVRDHTGNVVAAISLAGLVQRLDPPRLPALIQLVKRAADLTSRDLGCSLGAPSSAGEAEAASRLTSSSETSLEPSSG